MRVVFSVAPAKTNVTKKARSLIARARPTNESSFSFSGLKLHAMFESLKKKRNAHRSLVIPCLSKKILQSCIQYVFSVHLCIHQKNMKQEQNRYVDRFFTG